MDATGYVQTNGRYFSKHGQEFFYLGDTAWMLLDYLTKEEAAFYFRRRAEQGFNAVQFVLLPEFGGLRRKNRYGDVPLLAYDDEIIPNPSFFSYARWCVEKANENGLTVGLLPTWGDKFNKRSGAGPEIFTASNTYDYAKYVSDWFSGLDVVFYLGGDKNPENERHYAIIGEFARGLREGESGDAPISYHVKGGYCSNDFFNDASWLDFSIYQSGHTKYALAESDRMKATRKSPTSYMHACRELNRPIVKPFMNGEPAYENHPQMCTDEQGRWVPIENPEPILFSDYDVRKDAYWSVFAGAAGFTYGANEIWQFSNPMLDQPITASSSLITWEEALELPGAMQMRHLKTLVGRFSPFTRQMVLDVVRGEYPEDQDAQVVACADGTLWMVYSPCRQRLEIDLTKVGRRVAGTWFDPKTGLEGRGFTIEGASCIEVDTPGNQDAILILENVED